MNVASICHPNSSLVTLLGTQFSTLKTFVCICPPGRNVICLFACIIREYLFGLNFYTPCVSLMSANKAKEKRDTALATKYISYSAELAFQ